MGCRKDMAPFASRALPWSPFCLQLCTRRARQQSMVPQDLHNAALAKPSTYSRAVPARVHDLQTKHNTHRRAARPQAAHKLNGSLHASGRSCASSEGCTNTLPALPLRVARGEHGSGANMLLLLNGMTLPIPSRDSPDKNVWHPATLQLIRKRKLLVRRK